MLKVVVGLFLLLLVLASPPVYANHWPHPFEFLNGTAHEWSAPCVQPETGQQMWCEEYIDLRNRIVYTLYFDKQDGVMHAVLRKNYVNYDVRWVYQR